MKNDSFFNWLIIIVSLLLSIGMFSKSLDYWWIPYLISLVTLGRYTDFLESKERDEAVVSFPIRRWSEPMSDEACDRYMETYHEATLTLIKDGLTESSIKWKCNDEDCEMYGCQCNE